jgi:hypothetical protein
MSDSEEMRKLLDSYDKVAEKVADKLRTGKPVPVNLFASWWARISALVITSASILQIIDIACKWTHHT